MPELRTDWLTGRRVIIAENRADRPNEFGPSGKHAIAENARTRAFVAPERLAEASSNCPFCPGHEGETPPTVYERHDDAGRWRIRVIPNKYPAVTPPAVDCALRPGVGRLEQSAGATPDSPGTIALSQPPNRALHVAPAIGAHEVIIESARHVTSTAALARSELRDVLQTYVERVRHWHADDQLRYALLFKNQGPDAGASLSHLHSQLLVIPEIPPNVAAELRRAEETYRHDRLCPYCR